MHFRQWKRREFLTPLGGAVAAWPLAARAQQPKLPTIGYLGVSTASSWRDWTAAFVRRLGELGWTEGRTVAIEYRWAEGRVERSAEIVADFVHRKVDVIVTGAPQSLQPSVQRLPSLSSSRLQPTRLAAASSRVWRGRAATSPACPSSSRMLLQADRAPARAHPRVPPLGGPQQCRLCRLGGGDPRG